MDTENVNYKELFYKRKTIETLQPYSEHTELFLGCIEPLFCAEVQKSLSYKALTNEESYCLVPKSEVNFLWQTTDDLCDNINGERVPNPAANRTFYGTINQQIRQLEKLNAKGANPCIAINEIEGSRRVKENVLAARAIWIDDDEKRRNQRPRPTSEFDLPYSFVVETSPGKYHYYWLTYTEDLRLWDRIQEHVMVTQYGSDSGSNGRNRAMRVPGFWHRKQNKFATRIVYMLNEESIQIIPTPSPDFKQIAEQYGGKKEFAFSADLCAIVKRYDWEEIVDTFGAGIKNLENNKFFVENIFNPVEAMEKVLNIEDYHSSLQQLCMHFANYVQDEKYVTSVVQGVMCRVPESNRDTRWHTRFNDISRSSRASVDKKIEELANATTLPPEIVEGLSPAGKVEDLSFHSEQWAIKFPDILGGCTPLDLLMDEFENTIPNSIPSFNFAAIMSFLTVCSQNIPIMPALGERKANGCHMLLGASTSGKDLNISGPLRALARALLNSGYVSTTDLRSNGILRSFLSSNAEITSLSAFHDWATNDTRTFGAIWTNTECTSIIAKMSDENANVSNLAEIVINIQDGTPIPGVHRSRRNEGSQSASDLIEAYTLLFATQPASIKKHMNPRLLYKGIIGRFDYYVPNRAVSEQYASTLSAENLKPYIFSDKILRFLGFFISFCSAHVTNTRQFENDVHSREVVVKYDNDDPDTRAARHTSHEEITDGRNRRQHIIWDVTQREKYGNDDDRDYTIFINRVPMSSERYLTILTFAQHVYDCYLSERDPFAENPIVTPELIKCACKLGDYQYEVRSRRIWSLIARNKGLDDKHQAMLDAIAEAEDKPSRWLKYMVSGTKTAYEYVFEKEKFISIGSIMRCLSKDAHVHSRDAVLICRALSEFGYIEYVESKRINVTISERPLKNLVRLTQQGRM